MTIPNDNALPSGGPPVAEQSDDLAIPGTLSATGLELPEGMKLVEWLRVMHTLKLIGKAVQWWVGDALAYGEDHFGETAFQALERADKTFANWASVCRSVDRSRRREDVLFSHHVEVAPLPPEKQTEVLERVAGENLTVRQTRELATQEMQSEAEEEHGKAQTVWTMVCPRCLGEGVVPVD